MDQLIFASLSHTHYWYEVGMLKVPACVEYTVSHENLTSAAWYALPQENDSSREVLYGCADLKIVGCRYYR